VASAGTHQPDGLTDRADTLVWKWSTDSSYSLSSEFSLQGHVPWFHILQRLAPHLEELGSSTRQDLPMVGKPRSLLDYCTPTAPRSPAPPPMSTL
jgi:hypothetical protein